MPLTDKFSLFVSSPPKSSAVPVDYKHLTLGFIRKNVARSWHWCGHRCPWDHWRRERWWHGQRRRCPLRTSPLPQSVKVFLGEARKVRQQPAEPGSAGGEEESHATASLRLRCWYHWCWGQTRSPLPRAPVYRRSPSACLAAEFPFRRLRLRGRRWGDPPASHSQRPPSRPGHWHSEHRLANRVRPKK